MKLTVQNQIPKAVPIKKIIQENPYVKTFVFEYKLGAKPGQFANLWIPRVDEKPMSIAYDNGKEFWVSMFAVGPFSKKMHQLKVGDMVGVRGPYGNAFSFKKGQHLVMMAGGYGVAPLYFLTLTAVKQGCTVDFVCGARSKDFLLYLNRIKKIKNVKLHVATDDGSVGIRGYNTTILEKLVLETKGKGAKRKKIACVYACGPEMMMKRISDVCFEEKLDAQLSVERYMKCGFGVCGQCTIDPTGERTCMEGPVMSNEHVRKLTEFGKYHRDSIGKLHNF